MTGHNELLLNTILTEIKGKSQRLATEHLIALGIISLRTCERHAIRNEVERQVLGGTPRTHAMDETAAKFCCSYEKVRGIIYNTYKQ
ncbi:MAG: hypothetical protein RSB23_05110 [Alistipes sp.]